MRFPRTVGAAFLRPNLLARLVGFLRCMMTHLVLTSTYPSYAKTRTFRSQTCIQASSLPNQPTHPLQDPEASETSVRVTGVETSEENEQQIARSAENSAELRSHDLGRQVKHQTPQTSADAPLIRKVVQKEI